jgi:FdhD protein
MNGNQLQIWKYEKGTLAPGERRIVREFPLRLTVNGRELATLIASPHQLNFLAAGFLRLQGFIDGLDDLLSLGVCADFGAAEIRIRGEVPARLAPVLTSGCGTGISFGVPGVEPPAPEVRPARFSPAAVLQLMRELARRADQYRCHGGIHSAAVGDGRELLLYAEDVGRHNTLDRLAGEALLRGVDLRGTMLVTSGRISTEMVAKASRLGIALLASRTSATDVAVRLAMKAGITLISYVRGESFEICTHPERLLTSEATGKIPGVTGVILAGGESRRMGCDKSLLPIAGARFIEHIHRRLAGLFEEVIVVTNSPGLYPDLPCRKVPDIYPVKGSLAGIHSGLCHARSGKIFVVACDMPHLSAETIRRLCREKEGVDVVVPHSGRGIEPLHALYDRSCLPAIEAALDAGEKRIVSFFPRVCVRELPMAAFAGCDPDSFRNINTPQEYFALRETRKEEPAAPAGGRRAEG